MRLATTLSLTAALLVAATAGRADPAAGEKAFTDNKCNDCHYTDGPAKEKTIDDQLAKKGPELWYAGDKFNKAWLQGWLADPKPIRPTQYGTFDTPNKGDHPKLAAADAGSVTDFLMSKTSGKVKKGSVGKGRWIKGKLLFMKKQPCKGCHSYPKRKKVLGGKSAPSLVGVNQRLNPDWIYAYMMQPEVFKPVKQMPVFTGILTKRDVNNLITFFQKKFK